MITLLALRTGTLFPTLRLDRPIETGSVDLLKSGPPAVIDRGGDERVGRLRWEQCEPGVPAPPERPGTDDGARDPVHGFCLDQHERARPRAAGARWPGRASADRAVADPGPAPGPSSCRAFRATDFVPDLRTRRMDRLSVWALLGSALALQDAGIDAAGAGSESRTAVVCGTAYGCLDLTAEFLGAVADERVAGPPHPVPGDAVEPAGQPHRAPLRDHGSQSHDERGPRLGRGGAAAGGRPASGRRRGPRHRARRGHAHARAVRVVRGGLAAGSRPASASPVPHRRAARRTIVPGEGLAACLLETGSAAVRASGPGVRTLSRGLAGLAPRERRRPRELEVERLLRQLLGDGRSPGGRARGPCAPPDRPGWRAWPAARSGATLASARCPASSSESSAEAACSSSVSRSPACPEAEHGFVLVAGPADRRVQAAAILVARPEHP